MKYLALMALLAAPIALAAAPTPADAAPGFRCHLVKKTVYKFGKKRTKWVKVCKPIHRHHR